MNENDIPRFRDAGLNPVGNLRAQQFADKKQSSTLMKILRSHMPKKAAPKRGKGKPSRGRSRTVEADSKSHFHGRANQFY